MNEVPKIPLSRENSLSWLDLSAIILLCMICMRAHEYAHIVSTVIQGSAFTSSFLSVNPSGGNRIASSIAGPLLTYLLMWTGLILLLRSDTSKRKGFELIFASSPVTRMTGYGFTIPGRDELAAARALHIADPIAAAIVWGIVLPPLVFAFFSMESRHRILWFLSFFIALPIVSAIPMEAGNLVLLESLKHSHFITSALASLFHGIPFIVLLFDVTITVLFLFISRLRTRLT